MTTSTTPQQSPLDTLAARHCQVLAILATLSLSFSSKQSEPTAENVQDTIDGARALLMQAQDAYTQLCANLGMIGGAA